jgi:D-beta-D-heptose 7-phosphate kinase/D-beta-D-heptose 1-phosphate adenosyltransferase
MIDDLVRVVRRLGRPRVVVVGDVMLDRYTFGTVERISPEAPVPVFAATEHEARLGGAASVTAMLVGLEAQVVLAGVVGNDEAGRDFHRLLEQQGPLAAAIVSDATRPTIVKHRYIGRAGDRHAQQVLRVDTETRAPLIHRIEVELLEALEPHLTTCDIILVSDYGKGVCTVSLLRHCIERARGRGVRVLVDPARAGDYAAYAGCSCLTPNRSEARLATGLPIDQAEQALAAGEQLLHRVGTEAVVITLDREGMALVHRDGRRQLFPTRVRQVYDVTGAGDMVLSVLGLCLAGGFDYEEAITLANVAAGLEVECLGVATLTRGELLTAVQRPPRSAAEHGQGRVRKLRSLPELLADLDGRRREGDRIVFTNGCFDILHAGHIHCLEQARALGELLVVGLNSDAGVRRLKGDGRPLHRAADRARVLAALACVDAVVIFEEDTPVRLIEAVCPHVLVKGSDYRPEQIAGREFVEAHGGRLVLLPLVDGLSSTRLRPHFTTATLSLPQSKGPLAPQEVGQPVMGPHRGRGQVSVSHSKVGR